MPPSGSHNPPTLPASWDEPEQDIQAQLASLPILYKVLIANALVVFAGAVVGTYTTVRFVNEDVVPTREGLVLLFGGLGVILSLAVNYWVLKVAFEPLDSLERVATAVRNGDFSARTEPWRFGDPQLLRFSDTFNQTLDELQRDREKIQLLANQVIRAQEDERQRVSRELHDDTAQVLFAQLLRLTALKSSTNDQVRETAREMEDLTVEAIESVRRLALELRPPALDDLGLREALGALVQRFEDQSHILTGFKVTGIKERLSGELELVLYRVAQEALTNVIKHAKAEHVHIDLIRTDDTVILSVTDDGVGIDSVAPKVRDGRGLGLGLFGMEERVQLVGGTLAVTPVDPHGTRITATIPLDTTASPIASASDARRAMKTT
jgi:two-component system sensor histidine kinase UhpB